MDGEEENMSRGACRQDDGVQISGGKNAGP